MGRTFALEIKTRNAMLRKTLVTLIAILLPFSALQAGDGKEVVKTGPNVGILPAFNYNNDLGFQLGGLGQLYQYGDGAIYPNYYHKFAAHAYVFSKGARQFVLGYDSKYLVPGLRVTVDAQYMDNPLCGFYGFNGAVSPYHADLDLRKSDDGKEGIAFYALWEKQLQVNLDLRGRISDRLEWLGGVQYSYQRYADVAIDPYVGAETLYHQYCESGLIPEEDTFGHRLELKAGVVYDTRDFEANPERGSFCTVSLTGGLSASTSRRGSLLLSADLRKYIPIIPSRLTFAGQVAYQGLLAGSLPFYALPAFAMRGSYGRRTVGNGVAWASTDLRLLVARFTALRQNIELGLVGFADAGGVIQTYRLQEQKAQGGYTIDKMGSGPYRSIYEPDNATRERLHASAGGGFFFAMNRNFITAVEFGKPLDPMDGNFGVYINLGFSF